MSDRKSLSKDKEKNSHYSNWNSPTGSYSYGLYIPSYIPLPSEQLSFSQNYLPSLDNARLSTVYNQLECESGYPQPILYNPNGYNEAHWYGQGNSFLDAHSFQHFQPSQPIPSIHPIQNTQPIQTMQPITSQENKSDSKKRKRNLSSSPPILDLRLVNYSNKILTWNRVD